MLRFVQAARPLVAAVPRAAVRAAPIAPATRALSTHSRTLMQAPVKAVASRALAAPLVPAVRGAAHAYTTRGAVARAPAWTRIAAAVSLAGIGGLTVYAIANSSSSLDELSAHSQQVRANIKATYMYVAGGLGVTAAAATSMFRSGLPQRMAAYNPWLVLGVSLVGTIGSMIATQAIEYNNTIPKHAAWLAFNSCIAASLCPLGVVGSPLIIKAALGTGVIVGSLSLMAFANPDRTFLKMTGPLTVGLGTMMAASIGTMFFPGSALLQGFVLYGGLGLFGFMVLHDTQAMITRAEYEDVYHHDPINSSIGIYMDTVQIFWRMVAILSGGGGRRK